MTDYENNDDMADEEFQNRVAAILAQAVAGLHPDDIADRITYCQQHNQPGVRVHLDDHDDVLTFKWGGRNLAMIERGLLLGDTPVKPVFIEETPDTIPEGWDTPPGGGEAP